ncbi:MAG: phosphocholine cytidylyltransferase family protein [Bacteroidales bacterium]|nr:phosphocholine cytidylyltransferase family protein [Bacteroidales bacterium]
MEYINVSKGTRGFTLIGIILAAGCGQRLSRVIDLDKIGPKCLLTINGCTLLERVASDLVSFNVDRINIVVGYKADLVQDVCIRLEEKYGVNFDLVHNENYLSTNTAYSLHIGLTDVYDDVVIFNGDVLYDYTILKNLLEVGQTAISVDNKKKLTDESFKLKIIDGLIEEMGKTIPIEDATGEFIGISMIAKEDLKEAKRLLKSLVSDNINNYYDFVYQSLSKSGDLAYSFTNGLTWTEIDDIHDLTYAKNIAGISDSRRGQI